MVVLYVVSFFHLKPRNRFIFNRPPQSHTSTLPRRRPKQIPWQKALADVGRAKNARRDQSQAREKQAKAKGSPLGRSTTGEKKKAGGGTKQNLERSKVPTIDRSRISGQKIKGQRSQGSTTVISHHQRSATFHQRPTKSGQLS